MSTTLLAIIVAFTAASLPEEDRPNIVFLLTDDHRADLLGCAGHPILKTPNIDRLAGRGRPVRGHVRHHVDLRREPGDAAVGAV